MTPPDLGKAPLTGFGGANELGESHSARRCGVLSGFVARTAAHLVAQTPPEVRLLPEWNFRPVDGPRTLGEAPDVPLAAGVDAERHEVLGHDESARWSARSRGTHQDDGDDGGAKNNPDHEGAQSGIHGVRTARMNARFALDPIPTYAVVAPTIHALPDPPDGSTAELEVQ